MRNGNRRQIGPTSNISYDADVSACQLVGRGTAVEHCPDRPLWDCRVCARPWPCGPARADMRDEMDRVALSVYMSLNLGDAVLDLADAPVVELFERFVAWIR